MIGRVCVLIALCDWDGLCCFRFTRHIMKMSTHRHLNVTGITKSSLFPHKNHRGIIRAFLF